MADDQDQLDELVLIHVASQKQLNVIGSLTDDGISYSYTYDAASELTIALHDPQWAILTSGYLDRGADGRLDAVDVELDGLWWRLTGVNPSAGLLTLSFEERTVQRLRAKYGHITVSRNKSTRAEFVRRLVKAIHADRIGFYSRELKDKQDIAQGTSSSSSSKDAGIAKDSAFKVKGEVADAEQTANVSTIVRVADEDGAHGLALKAGFVAAIGESEIRKGAVDHVYGTHKGVFQSNVIPPNDLEAQAHHFFTGGRSFRAGGAIQAAKDHPEWSAGKVASYVEISDADGSFYDKYADEAEAIMKLAGSDVGTSRTIAKPYQFAVAKDEDYWTAIQRLAAEVDWRAFMHRGVLYFMDDYQLLRGTPMWTIACLSDPAVTELPEFEWDHRGGFPQEMTLSTTLPRGFLSAGDVVNVTEAGPGNGRWIVAEVSGTWFGKVVQLRLVQPQVPKLEPAHDTLTVDEGGSSATGKFGKLLDKLKDISSKDMPYVWGGGHNADFSPTGGGYDCSGYIGAGLHAGGFIEGPMTSGEMMKIGKPGRGEKFTIYASGQHVFLVLENGSGGKYKRADTSPQGGETKRGPHVRTADRSTSGFTPRHFEGY